MRGARSPPALAGGPFFRFLVARTQKTTATLIFSYRAPIYFLRAAVVKNPSARLRVNVGPQCFAQFDGGALREIFTTDLMARAILDDEKV